MMHQYEVGIAPHQFNPDTSVIGESSHNVSQSPPHSPHVEVCVHIGVQAACGLDPLQHHCLYG
jgi:hypothetical protein